MTLYNPPEKLLSMLCHGRNDSYMGNYLWRLSTTINKNAMSIFSLNAQNEVEILLCDWGSTQPLIEVLSLTDEAKALLRLLVVPSEIANKYNADSPYSGVHPVNAVARRASGKYLLLSDSDAYIPIETMRNLFDSIQQGSIGGLSLSNTFFWASRYHIPKSFHSARNPSIEEIDDYITKHWKTFAHDKISKQHFRGAGAALLMPRKMWHECRGLDERLIYWGWNDIDLHRRLNSRYDFADLEDFGMPFFHLEHYSEARSHQSLEKENPRKMNPMNPPQTFAVNTENWGLANEPLQETSYSSPLLHDVEAQAPLGNRRETNKIVLSPLTNRPNVMLERQISCRDIIQAYRQGYNIDVAKYFAGLENVQIYRCLDTDFRFYYPLDLEGDSEFYEALQHIPWYYMDWKWEHDIARNLIKPSERVLEIGCGKGSFVETLMREGISCTGLELNEDSVRRGKEKGLNITNETINQHSRNYFEQYDVVCSFQVMEHIASIKAFIQDSINVLAPGGKLIISVPNHDSFVGLDYSNVLDMPPHHLGLWNEKSLKSISDIFNIKFHKFHIESLQSYHIQYYIDIMKRSISNEFGLHEILNEIVHNSSNKIKGHTVIAEYIKL